MKALINFYHKAMLGMVLMLGGVGVSQAQQQVDLRNFKGTSGAGSSNVNSMLNNGTNTVNNLTNFVLMLFAAAGIIIVGLSIFSMWKASKDERESPKGAIVGLIAGAAMTAVALIAGLIANTINV